MFVGVHKAGGQAECFRPAALHIDAHVRTYAPAQAGISGRVGNADVKFMVCQTRLSVGTVGYGVFLVPALIHERPDGESFQQPFGMQPASGYFRCI